MAAPLLITINPVFVLSSRRGARVARASLSFKFKIKSKPSRHFAPFAVKNSWFDFCVSPVFRGHALVGFCAFCAFCGWFEIRSSIRA